MDLRPKRPSSWSLKFMIMEVVKKEMDMEEQVKVLTCRLSLGDVLKKLGGCDLIGGFVEKFKLF